MFLYWRICEATLELLSSIDSNRSSSLCVRDISWRRLSYALILVYCLYHALLLWAISWVILASLDSKLGASMPSLFVFVLAFAPISAPTLAHATHIAHSTLTTTRLIA